MCLGWRKVEALSGHCEFDGCMAGGSHRMYLMGRVAGLFCSPHRVSMQTVWDKASGGQREF